MGHMTTFLRTRAAAALVMTAALTAIAVMTDAASAATKSKTAVQGPAAASTPATQAPPAAAAAHAAYDAGVKSYQAGKFEPAVQSFTAALRGGGLPSNDMAHALYYRGLSYKKQSKPGLAISDLTSALWLKNGLSDSERASATSERAEAYRLAGLGDGNSGNEKVAVADPNIAARAAEPSPAVAAAAAPGAAAAPKAASTRVETQQAMPDGTFGVAPGTSDTAARAVPAPASRSVDHGAMQTAALNQNEPLPGYATATAPAVRTAVATQPVPQAIQQAAAVPVSIPAPAPARAAQPVLPAAPIEGASTTAAAATGAPSTVSSFFSNMFGGSKTAAPAGAAILTTASTVPAATGGGGTAAAGSVASAKKMAAVAATNNATTAAGPVVAAAAAPAPAPQVKGGKYKIHIAAVRSRAEAEALAQRLVQQQGAALASRTPTVDEAVIGSMGTFYRVRVGSFATAEEPRGLCNTLRTSGYDCLVVTN